MIAHVGGVPVEELVVPLVASGTAMVTGLVLATRSLLDRRLRRRDRG
ncbi:MAG TPA: hypothetical protein VFQ28_07080 [Gaiella sp.]|nr:hypothetical protein [Gaiella sp.]